MQSLGSLLLEGHQWLCVALVCQDERRKIRTQEYRGTDPGVAGVVVVVVVMAVVISPGLQ